jgi:hypothetical protein
MSDGKTYRIKTVGEFLELSAEQRASALEEFANWLNVLSALKEFVQPDPTFIWIDDGKREITVRLDIK